MIPGTKEKEIIAHLKDYLSLMQYHYPEDSRDPIISKVKVLIEELTFKGDK